MLRIISSPDVAVTEQRCTADWADRRMDESNCIANTQYQYWHYEHNACMVWAAKKTAGVDLCVLLTAFMITSILDGREKIRPRIACAPMLKSGWDITAISGKLTQSPRSLRLQGIHCM